MKVVHVPFGYYPDPVGGTEVYVAELVESLRRRGIDSVVAAPSLGVESRTYEHGGVAVHRFVVGATTNVSDLYGEGDAVSAAAIERILADTKANVLHLHAFTTAASLKAVHVARRRGVAVAFTYHTPTASCVRGTLLRNGIEVCDGELIEQRCASCLLESRGAGEAVRELLSRMPPTLGSAVGATGAAGPWVTALRARELTRKRHAGFRQLLQRVDAVIAVCEWVRSLLLRAGATPSRLMLSRQGTSARPRVHTPSVDATVPLRLAFVGRLHPTKGVHVVVKALASRPALRATLDVYGVAQDASAMRYAAELRSLAAGDARIRFLSAVPRSDVVPTLAEYDATVVPSQWLETGPLTVLESFAAGLPVMGSNLGGVAELVSHDADGWLVPHADVAAWATAIERLVADRSLLVKLTAGVQRPRSTDDVARDMASVYEAIAGRTNGVGPGHASTEPGTVAAGVV